MVTEELSYFELLDSSLDLFNPTVQTIARLDDRNRIATELIADYANRHAKWDVGFGIASLVPGLAIPALATAILEETSTVYQPLARDLAKVYTADPSKLDKSMEALVGAPSPLTEVFDIGGDFDKDFMISIIDEVIYEAGHGLLGALFVPVLSGSAGAAFDYLASARLTWRVGTMVSIYYQNGDQWIETQQRTWDVAKVLTGTIRGGVDDLIRGKFKDPAPRVDLSEIRRNVFEVRKNLQANARELANRLKTGPKSGNAKEMMKARGIPRDLIQYALGDYSEDGW